MNAEPLFHLYLNSFVAKQTRRIYTNFKALLPLINCFYFLLKYYIFVKYYEEVVKILNVAVLDRFDQIFRLRFISSFSVDAIDLNSKRHFTCAESRQSTTWNLKTENL